MKDTGFVGFYYWHNSHNIPRKCLNVKSFHRRLSRRLQCQIPTTLYLISMTVFAVWGASLEGVIWKLIHAVAPSIRWVKSILCAARSTRVHCDDCQLTQHTSLIYQYFLFNVNLTILSCRLSILYWSKEVFSLDAPECSNQPLPSMWYDISNSLPLPHELWWDWWCQERSCLGT